MIKSHLFTERKHPPRGLEGLVHHVVRLHADCLQLWLALRLSHFVSEKIASITEKHFTFLLWEARCALCNHLSLCLLWPPSLLSSVHLSLLSSLRSDSETPEPRTGGTKPAKPESEREAVGLKWMNVFYSVVDGSAWWWKLIQCWEKFSLDIYLYDKLMSLVGTWRETHQVHINTN